MSGTSFRLLDYRDPGDAATLVALLDAYARDPAGGGEALGEEARAHLAERLAERPDAFSIVGEVELEGDDDVAGARALEPVALANCFVTLSTFAARPIVYVHDLMVVESMRGRGTGRALLEAIEREARRRGAVKLTLEVLEGNAPARAAYERFGFVEYRLDGGWGAALFRQKHL